MKRAIGMLMVARWAGVNANGFYRTITLDQPASDLTDFPVLFSGTYTYLKTIANGGKVNNSNGYDIIFYSDAALTTKLKFERVFWDATTGDVEFWIKIPTLTSASATVIYLAYGNTSISTDQQDANNTWNSSYQGVYHFPDGTTLTANDSTASGFNGTINSVVAGTGKIDGGANWNTTANIVIGLNNGTIGQPISISAWLNLTGTTGFRTIIGGNANSTLQWRVTNATNTMQLLSQSSALEFQSTQTVPASTWTYVVLTIDASNNVSVYFNAAAPDTGTKSGTPFASATSLIGSNNASAELYIGIMDELRVTNNVLTATWIATEYSNQNDPANFYVVGSETNA